jgi:UDP-N-acetylglucosamine--N-acetylmuramyl-(pentapeptide) pyrophosphoryl-undecaprenol N-acetylglucosamine transferase
MSEKMTRIALVGGGSGGHVFPALAVAHELRQAREGVTTCLGIGRKPIEMEWALEREELADLFPVRLHAAPAPYGCNPFGWAKAAIAAGLGTAEAWMWWTGWQPTAALMFGGYVSVPAAIAARARKIPYLFHSADALPDRSARTLAEKAALVTVNYAEAADKYGTGVRVEVTGQPVRPWLLGGDRKEAAKSLGLDAAKRTVLVVGGSQGARSVNRAAIEAAKTLLADEGTQMLHLCGMKDYEELVDRADEEGLPVERYRVLAFLREVEWALALADVAVTRAGANGMAELAAAGVAMIVVPYPHAGGHQRLNALPLKEAGGGVIVEDEDLSGERLADEVGRLLADDGARRSMGEAARRWVKPDAARRVAELVLQVADESA